MVVVRGRGGATLVALVIAELSTHFPLSGYGYQWTSRLVNPRFGYFVGWLLLLQFMTGFPGVCNALAAYMHEYVLLEGYITVPWLTVLIITAIALIHIAGIKVASRVNDVGVTAEIVGSVLITVVLLAVFGFDPDRSLAVLRERTNFETGQPATSCLIWLQLTIWKLSLLSS